MIFYKHSALHKGSPAQKSVETKIINSDFNKKNIFLLTCSAIFRLTFMNYVIAKKISKWFDSDFTTIYFENSSKFIKGKTIDLV